MTLWQSRFSDPPANELMEISKSLSFDKVLAPYDIKATVAHVKALAKLGILSQEEADILQSALNQVKSELESDNFKFDKSDEDIHTAIERRVTEIAPEVGQKLHTGRSRNDQVAVAFRLYLKDELYQIGNLVINLIKTLEQKAYEYLDVTMPGYTHMQRAQPVLVSHYLLAHIHAFLRDCVKITNTLKNLNISPLGAGALAGSSLEIDTELEAIELGFEHAFENSIDAVSDRDFVAEALFVICLCFIHLSRICEEIIIFSTQEFNFVLLHDSFSTGSSMMPQKKNPDICELIRGKAGRAIGNLTGFLATLKGLPLAYNRDLQEDKEPVFDSVKQLKIALVSLEGLIKTMSFNQDSLNQAVNSNEFLFATDLAEYLVKKGMPFRKAYKEISAMVKDALERKVSFEELISAHPDLGVDALNYLKQQKSTELKQSRGSTSLASVKNQLTSVKTKIKELQNLVATYKP